MRPSVLAGFHGFSVDLEGRLPFMYLDVKGLVTTGVGNLVDLSPAPAPWRPACALPWRTADGELALAADIIAEWERVKARQDLRKRGGGAYGKVTTLRLTDTAIDQLVERKLLEVDRQLSALFPAWEEWPADAQMFGCSWAWAVGAGAAYPKMIAHLRAGDFAAAAEECRITDGTGKSPGTLTLRNARNKVLLLNAARVVAAGLDPDELYWPTVVQEPVTIVGEPDPAA